MRRVEALLGAAGLLKARLATLAALGLLAGLAFGRRYQLLHPEVFIQLAIFVMIYPMMLGVTPADLGRIVRSRPTLSGSVVLNFLVSPLLALGLALVFLRGEQPEFAAGLVLLGLVPCGNMSAVYAGLAEGNVPLALGIVALSYLLDLPLVPLLSKFFVGRFVSVPLGTMMGYLFWVILVPLTAATVTRRVVSARLGEVEFGRLAQGAAGLSVLGLAVVVFVISSVRAQELLAHPGILLRVVLPVPLLLASLAVLAVLWARAARLAYDAAVSLIVTSATKNVAVALALATVAFGPLAALPIIMAGPFLQVPFVLALVRVMPRLRPFIERGR